MLSKQMEQRLLEQVRNEWVSEFYYLELMSWCFNNDFDGFGMWFLKQSQEEHEHGMKILRFVNDAGGTLKILPITPPVVEIKDIEHVFELTWEHEQKVTAMIHELYAMAINEKDYPTQNFLQWFINEQLEEESTVRNIVAQLKRVKGAPAGLFMIEAKLAARQ